MKRLAVLSFTIATLIAPTFSQAASGLGATQPAVEATTKAAASGVFNFDGELQPSPQKPRPWWWSGCASREGDADRITRERHRATARSTAQNVRALPLADWMVRSPV